MSQVLLNGGLGASSQLNELNQMLIKQARRAAVVADEEEGKHEVQHGQIPVMSCDEAIMVPYIL